MSNEKQTEAKEKVSNCVCLKCYKLRCKSRSNPKEYCTEMKEVTNEQRKTD